MVSSFSYSRRNNLASDNFTDKPLPRNMVSILMTCSAFLLLFMLEEKEQHELLSKVNYQR